MMGEYKVLSLSQLKVNPQNPRYRNPRISESDAIFALFKEIKKKPEAALRHMLNLIDDVARHGINPAELPIVVPDPNEQEMYQVMEGNRRVASLKLLYFPDLAAEVFRGEPRVLERLEAFRKDFLDRFKDQYKQVQCVIYQAPEEAHHWIFLRHTGENEGRGVTPWDKAAKDRFRLQAAERKHTIATQVVEVLTQEGYLKSDVPVVLSTVERMVKDPDVASRLGIEIMGDEFELPSDPQLRKFALKALQCIALDTVEKDQRTKQKRLTSRNINQKSQRLAYLGQVIDRISEDKETIPFEAEGSIISPTPVESRQASPLLAPSTPLQASVSPSLPSRPPAGQDYRRRQWVAAKGMKVGHSTLHHLYQELCRLDAERYPNVGIMGIRAFLEGSLDVFIQQFMDEPEFSDFKNAPGTPFKIPLRQKTERVIDCLERRGILPANIAQAIRKYQFNKDNLLSIDTLQAYLHNPELEPQGKTVRYWWDAYHPFLEVLWNTYNAIKG